MEVSAIVASNLTRLREAAGLTQGQLAARSNMSRTTVNRLERNSPLSGDTSVGILQQLADALEVPVSELLKQPKEARRRPKAS